MHYTTNEAAVIERRKIAQTFRLCKRNFEFMIGNGAQAHEMGAKRAAEIPFCPQPFKGRPLSLVRIYTQSVLAIFNTITSAHSACGSPLLSFLPLPRTQRSETLFAFPLHHYVRHASSEPALFASPSIHRAKGLNALQQKRIFAR